LKFWKCEAKRR